MFGAFWMPVGNAERQRPAGGSFGSSGPIDGKRFIHIKMASTGVTHAARREIGLVELGIDGDVWEYEFCNFEGTHRITIFLSHQ